MSRITSSVGLITGIPIEETVSKLMAVAARPRELVANRTKTLDAERLAVTKLTSLVLAFQFEANRVGTESLFESKTANSSDAKSLKAAISEGANPAIGSYRFRALQTAAAHQVASGSLQSVSDLNTSGSFRFGFGGFVDKGIALGALNSGAGVRAGTIRITDRSGSTAEIDLRTARTVDDVLRAINNNSSASVSASVQGDQFVLTDSSGGSGNLKVQDVGAGKTAVDLGLATINVASNSAAGVDVFRLHEGTKLDFVNDGTGVLLVSGDDLSITFADESTLNVDLGDASTIGDILTALNTAAPTKISATIATDGNRIELTDLTTGGGTFAISNAGTGSAATALGLTVGADGDTITGRRLVSGLKDTLTASLHGGVGIDSLGVIDITNRNGVTSNVDLSAAETLGEVVAAINAQVTGVSAAINSARNGITLSDTTGAIASNLIVADGDGTESATALGLAENVAAANINSGSLDRRQIGRATLLSTLNAGTGIDIGDLLITDRTGATGAVDLNTVGNEAKTIGDVIDRINALTMVDVEARINATGDGILLIDNSGGTGTLTVANSGSHTTAEDLRLHGGSVEQLVDGITKTVIDGSTSFAVDLSDLESVSEEIPLSSLNGGTGVSAGSFLITDRDGATSAITINSSITTVADVIAAINGKGIGVEARINDAGTGILLFDTTDGSGTLAVQDLAGGTAAADLGLDAPVTTLTIDGESRSAINGAGTFTQSAAQTGLSALAARINGLGAGVKASTIYDGVGYRLVLTAEKTGAANELLIDGEAAGLDFTQLEAARDAVLEVGSQSGGGGLVVTSADNTFHDVIPGLELTVAAASASVVTIDVTKSQTQITDTIGDFVDAFNSIRTNLDQVTAFDPEALTTGVLFGSSAALRVESDLNRVLTGRYFGVGKYASLESIGLVFDGKGKMSLNSAKLQEALADDPAAVERLFTDKTLGVAAKLKSAIDSLAGTNDSFLGKRAESLASVIQANKDRITFMDERLTRERERLLLTFAQLESTIAAMQQNLTALSGLQPISPLTSTSG